MTESHHPELEHWKRNIGHDIVLAGGEAPGEVPQAIDVLCWNIAIGKGRLLERIRAIRHARHRPNAERPFIALVQEAFRTHESFPALTSDTHHGGHAPREPREDIVNVAEQLGFALVYSPSMRNGRHDSDRGNAILSSVPLIDAQMITLPYVRQRRTAVSAKLEVLPSLRMVSVHLDTRGRHQPHESATTPRGGFGAGRATQAAALAERLHADDARNLLVGGDLNSYLGLRDPAVKEFVAAGFRHATRSGRWRHTFHPLRLMLDHVLYCTDGLIERVDVQRIDEGRDRASRVYGSDHHPLLATITLRR